MRLMDKIAETVVPAKRHQARAKKLALANSDALHERAKTDIVEHQRRMDELDRTHPSDEIEANLPRVEG